MIKSCVARWSCFIVLLLVSLPALAFDGVDVIQVRDMAEAGNADAQSKLGVLYSTGMGGLKMDKKEALKWYEKSARQGNPLGEWNLAFMYVRGDGVAADLAKARELFRKAAEKGLANAQYDLGIMLLDGLGGDQDPKEAEKWFHLAADQDYREAKKILKELVSAQP